ncbi:hypothetical protein TUBRATIS_16410 [Tubulinosema ratisbonensis]|uniref:Uncharacterized protein n=1 Tax=Tubulinosema ratisbonensis TaxID=291195 RepID=A0A437ALC7_9MICR|nr:hypothetical protein TUBRATIS_16410 [Tubulinosema ratisbonensis]
MNYESMIIFVIFLRATKRRRMETNFNSSETYCDDILVNNEKRSKLNDNKTNLSNLTEDSSLEDFLLNQPTNFNLFSFISADNQETGLEKNDNLILDDNLSLTEDLQEFISNECDFLSNLLNQCNSNSEDKIDLTEEQPEPSNEPEVIVIDSESKEENQSISSDSLDLGNDFIKKVVNMQSESENSLLDLGNDVLFSDVLNTHKKDDLCEESFKINKFSNKKECFHSKYENQPDLQNQKVAHQDLSVVNDGLSNSVSQDLEKILDECINDKSLRIEESESEKNDINQTRNFSDLINDQRPIFLDESLLSQDTSMGNENVNDSFTNHKKIIPLTIEQNSSDSLNLLESLSEALSSTVNQTILLENPKDINKCESDFYNKMVRFNSNKMIGLFEDDGHPFEIGLGIPIRPGLVIYRIEKRTHIFSYRMNTLESIFKRHMYGKKIALKIRKNYYM